MATTIAKAPVSPDPRDLACVALREAAWRDPVEAAAPFAEEAYAGLLLSGATGWSYLVREPDVVLEPVAPEGALDQFLQPASAPLAYAPPFQGGVVGLAAYELAARLEPTAPAQRHADWPDLILARYPVLLAFDSTQRRVVALGRGATAAEAERRAEGALSWLDRRGPSPAPTGPLAVEVRCDTEAERHAAAVAETVGRIARGEIFQANLARPWRGRLAPEGAPFHLFQRLARTSPAPYAAYWRLPHRALVSNSPERFLSVRSEAGGLWAESSPVKGTRPRGRDPAADAALSRELLASEKDRAENLMIVDLMRNDLSRVCAPGSVSVPELAALRSYANVHHLVSRVRGRLAPGHDAFDLFLAAFPPGSITGAPKLQAMKVIAEYEPPRGPYCGSLFWAGADGALEASVLIRTVAFREAPGGWAFEARAGGGIVADSDPDAEVRETEHKISAILAALTGTAP